MVSSTLSRENASRGDSSSAQLNALALRAKDGDKVAENALMCKLGKAFRKLVGTFNGYSSCLEPEDLLQEALVACHAALGNFQPACGDFFSYIYTVARNAIIDAIVEYCGAGMSKKLMLAGFKVQKAESKFFAEWGYVPSDEELAKYGAFTADAVESVRSSRIKLSSMDRLDEDDGRNCDDFMDRMCERFNREAVVDQEACANQQTMEERIPTLLDTLSEVDRRIIVMSTMGDCTLEEIKKTVAGEAGAPHSLEGLRKRRNLVLKKLGDELQSEMDNVA